VKRKGVLYDVGRVMWENWRPDYHPAVVHRELEIIKDDLHCNAVKICARDIGRLKAASEDALHQGLEVWFSPELWSHGPARTLDHIATAAVAAEELRCRWPRKIVFSVGTELTPFMRGIIDGRTFGQRISRAGQIVMSGVHNQPLNAFLARADGSVRAAFGGPLSYASLPFEQVDWDLFDLIGVDHYWHELIEDRYLRTLEPLLGTGKPIVITEFGFRTRTGADKTGAAGPENIEPLSMMAHLVPGVRRLVRPRVKTIHERDQSLQARSLVRQLELLDSADVDGAFIHTFTAPLFTHGNDPRHDLDTDSFSLVKTYPPGGHGRTYPYMTWEPKESFGAVADYYATH